MYVLEFSIPLGKCEGTRVTCTRNPPIFGHRGKRLNTRTLTLAAILSLGGLPALADFEVSGSVQIHAKADFEAPLAAHGAWIEAASYGRCWRPGHVAVGWRPYCAGEWVWTDCGWYWASNEPWGWACYHYGWWAYDSSHGWVWVPHVEWAPAWVSWRVGGGYIGWAPLCPPGRVFARYPSPDHFVFVGTVNFGGPVKVSALIVKNAGVFGKTTLVGGVKRETRNLDGAASRKVMVNHGPGVDMIQKASGKTLSPAPITQVARRSPGPSSSKSSGAEFAAHNSHSSDKSDQNHGADRADSPAKDNDRSSPQRSSDSGFDRGSSSGSSNHGRQGGGGHGRH
jgi:hypothetical protein